MGPPAPRLCLPVFLEVLRQSDNQEASMLGSLRGPSPLPDTQIPSRPIRLQQLLISCFPEPCSSSRQGPPGAGALPGPGGTGFATRMAMAGRGGFKTQDTPALDLLGLRPSAQAQRTSRGSPVYPALPGSAAPATPQ